MHSTTKYLNGHSDSVGGVVVATATTTSVAEFVQNAEGAILGPFRWLTARDEDAGDKDGRHNANGSPWPSIWSHIRKSPWCITRDCLLIPSTRWRRSKCADSAG